MKHTATLLALTFSLSAFTALAQSQGDQAKQIADRPAKRDKARMERNERRGDDTRARRLQRRNEADRRQLNRAPDAWRGSRQEFAPNRQGFGPQQRFGRGPQRFDAPRRGPAWDGPPASPRGQFGEPQASPRRNWSPGPEGAPAWRGRDGQGFGPREDLAPMRRGFGPQGRGPAFGPPPWAGRGAPDSDLRPGPRQQRQGAPAFGGRGFGPNRRGYGAPDAPTTRPDHPDRGLRSAERGPRNAPPADSDDR